MKMKKDLKKMYNWSIEQGDYEISYKSSKTYLKKQKRKKFFINILKAASIISIILVLFLTVFLD